MRHIFIILITISCIMLLGCSFNQTSYQLDTTNLIDNMTENVLQMKVSGYEKGNRIPAKFATKNGGGENISIGVTWQTLPAAQSYALLFDDRHPVANNWVHWLVVDISNTANEIPEGGSRTNMPLGARELMTSWGQTGYDGPQPPVGSGDHEYVATLYALDVSTLNIGENITRAEFLKAIEGHVIAEEGYGGWFERR